MRGLMKAVDAAGGWEPLAERLGVRAGTLRRWSRAGAMPLAQARRISEMLGVRITGNASDMEEIALLAEAKRAGFTLASLAKALGIEREVVRQWKRAGRVPAKWREPILRLMKGMGR